MKALDREDVSSVLHDFSDGEFASDFAMNKTVIIVVSEMASTPDNRALISLTDSSMCFLCINAFVDWASELSAIQAAEVHRTACKRAASVTIRENQADSVTSALVERINIASGQLTATLALLKQQTYRRKFHCAHIYVTTAAYRAASEWESL